MSSKKIIKDQIILSMPCKAANKNDLSVAKDLKDTLLKNKERAIGLAANMIGINKKIIAIFIGPLPFIMINPKILDNKNEYITEEGCLSLPGQRSVKRYEQIKLSYLNENFEEQVQEYDGLVAEAIQHEIDHCNGILI